MSLETSDRSCLLSSVLALCFVMGISCGQGLRLSEEPRPDLLIVTVDTARADRFSFMGSNLVPTPNLACIIHEPLGGWVGEAGFGGESETEGLKV